MVLKFEPVLIDKIWGGDYFQKHYGYEASKLCGEAWGISGYQNHSSRVLNSRYQGMTLYDLYQRHPELFGYYKNDEFPILIKLIEAKKDLSIQVHPDDDYAQQHHNSLGKTECWYILDTKPNSQIIIGHNASSLEQLESMVINKDYKTLLNTFPIFPGDIFNIPAGTIHAICEGTVLLEVQQSSNITYRFYDYDRLEDGNPRELHLDKALEVIDVPSKDLHQTGETDYFIFEVKTLIPDSYQAHVYGDYMFVMDGTGQINHLEVSKGDFIFIPSKERYKVSKKLKVGYVIIK